MQLNFYYMPKNIAIWSLTLSILLLMGCSQEELSDNPNNRDKKRILEVYASKYLSDENHKLYYKSEKKEHISGLFDFPLTKEDLKLPKIAVLPGTDVQPADTLFTHKEIEEWGKQLSTYKQRNWSQASFPDFVSFINDKEIPEYLKKHSASPPKKESLYIHYITPPLLHNDKSALIYARDTKGAGSTRINYIYFKKINSEWKLIKKVRFRSMY